MTQRTEKKDNGRPEWQTQEQYERGLRADAEREAGRRSLSTKFKVWRNCAIKNCLRAKACSGGDRLCLFTFLRSLTPHERLYLQKLLEARCSGLTGEAARRAANAAFIEAVERLEAADAFRLPSELAPDRKGRADVPDGVGPARDRRQVAVEAEIDADL